jgi:hypothetical protein
MMRIWWNRNDPNGPGFVFYQVYGKVDYPCNASIMMVIC